MIKKQLNTIHLIYLRLFKTNINPMVEILEIWGKEFVIMGKKCFQTFLLLTIKLLKENRLANRVKSVNELYVFFIFICRRLLLPRVATAVLYCKVYYTLFQVIILWALWDDWGYAEIFYFAWFVFSGINITYIKI